MGTVAAIDFPGHGAVRSKQIRSGQGAGSSGHRGVRNGEVTGVADRDGQRTAQAAPAVLFCAVLLGFIANSEDATWRDIAVNAAYLLPAVVGIVVLNLPSLRSVSRTA